MVMAKSIKMMSGYAFEASKRGWQRSKDDNWEIVAYTPDGKERFLGFRSVDGSRVAVFSCGDGMARAQTTVSLGVAGLR